MSKSKPKILIVEDETMLNEAYQTILQREAYEIDAVYDGKEALEHIEKNGDPDLILLDLRMPRMDGLEFLAEYKPSQHTEVKILVFSNLDDQAEIDKAFDLGAHKYIMKAWASPKELVRVAADMLAAED